jgi:hypothetical protein
LRRLFLLLFLRGRTSRGLKRNNTPRSVGRKLGTTLAAYALIGMFAMTFLGQPVFSLSAYLHAMTFVFLGMFVAASAGEILFNEQEADILLHRPVAPRELLRAKVMVLVEVSLWLAGALNLAGMFAGVLSSDGGWRFPLIHAASSTLEALFCAALVVLIYQLCLRWFGRERLVNLMTAAQVLVAVAAVASGQLLPRMAGRLHAFTAPGGGNWWIALLPPAWFAGMDDAVAGSGAMGAWVLAGIGVAATLGVLAAAFGKLAQDYGTGLQTLGEHAGAVRKRVGSAGHAGRGRVLEKIVSAPPLRWWLRDPVVRASFLLSAAYLLRDRDMKLRMYPGLAPFVIMPLIIMAPLGGPATGNDFFLTFAATYVGLVPLLAMTILRDSQQWQASDLFRVVPIEGPARLCRGAMRAVALLLAVPCEVLMALVILGMHPGEPQLLLFMAPGLIALPVFAMLPCSLGKGVPLSHPTEEGRRTRHGTVMIGAMFCSMALAGIARITAGTAWFWVFLGVEAALCGGIYLILGAMLKRARWESME